MYGSFANELDEIGECVLRGERYAGKISHTLCSKNLRIAIRREIGEALHKKFPCIYDKVLKLRSFNALITKSCKYEFLGISLTFSLLWQ